MDAQAEDMFIHCGIMLLYVLAMILAWHFVCRHEYVELTFWQDDWIQLFYLLVFSWHLESDLDDLCELT